LGADWRHARRWLAFLLPFALMACGGQGCTGCSTPGPPKLVPANLLLPAATQVRLTQHGFDVIAKNILALLKIALGGGGGKGAAVLDVAKLLGPKALTFSGGLGLFQGKASARDLVLTLDLKKLQIDLVEGSSPARIRISIDHGQLGIIKGIVAGEASFAGIASDAACHLQNGVGVGGATPHLATVSATLDLVLGVDGAGKLQIQTVIDKPVLHDVGFALAKDCGLAECTDKLLLEPACIECEVCVTGKLASDAVAALKTLLEPILGDILKVVGNVVVQQVLASQLNGKPLDIEVPVDVRALVQAASPQLGAVLGPAGTLQVRGRPSPQAFRVLQGALETRLDAGLWAKADPCVAVAGVDAPAVFQGLPQGPAPPIPQQMNQVAVGGATQARTVDLALLIGRNLIEEAVWSASRSGLLCAAVESRQLYQLSGGQLVLSAGVLDLLLPGARELSGATAPVRIATMPSADPAHVPAVTLADDPSGTQIRVKIKDFGVRMELFVRGRWLTVLEAKASLGLRLDVQVIGGKLVVRVADVSVADVAIADGGLFPHADVAGLAPGVVQIAVGLLFAQPLQFDLDVAAVLGQALALPLSSEVIGIRTGGPAADWLMLGVTLESAP